ncbi:MAG: hypothetical protein B7Z71_09995, partial [Acidocella sp. 21-58-7]
MNEAIANQLSWPFREAERVAARLKEKGKTSALFETGYGPSGLPHIGTFGEVSRTTNGFKVERIVAAFECGAIVNPDGLRNQVSGAIVQAIGGALFEQILFANGRILNPHLAAYRLPRFSDTPEIEVVLLDRKDLPSSGAGETGLVGVAPAVGNAIFAATGTRLHSL